MMRLRLENVFGFITHIKIIGFITCIKIREWLNHIPGSKLVPLQFLGKWDEDNAIQYYDASITTNTM